MVVIRIKENDENQIPKIIGNDKIKINGNLKMGSFTYNEIDEKIEKRFEYLINNQTESSADYNNTGDEYTIFGLQQGYNRYNDQGTSSNTYRSARTNSNTNTYRSARTRTNTYERKK
jgi:hypothetical protein